MPTPFDPGYGQEPFRTLVADVPDAAVFPSKDFRVEWGPVFHRGRLDGSARLLIIGQDPAQHEVIARRTLVGGAGHRLQGFLAKLGLTRSYVMVNTYVYSVFGQGGGNRHKTNAAIAAYRNRWFDALLPGSIQGVVALGQLADAAWHTWRATPKGATFTGVYTPVTHPTQPESSSKGNKAKREAATKKMLEGWNAALALLQPAITPDVATPLVPYGATFQVSELPDIPQEDFPAGSPPWMCGNTDWAKRTGTDEALKGEDYRHNSKSIPTSLRHPHDCGLTGRRSCSRSPSSWCPSSRCACLHRRSPPRRSRVARTPPRRFCAVPSCNPMPPC